MNYKNDNIMPGCLKLDIPDGAATEGLCWILVKGSVQSARF